MHNAFLAAVQNPASLVSHPSRMFKTLFSGIDLAHVDTLVEIGPGTADLTREILAHASACTRIIAFETNPRCANAFDSIDDPRLRVIHESDPLHITHWLKQSSIPSVEMIISTLPLLRFHKPDAYHAIHRMHDILAHGGKLMQAQSFKARLSLFKKVFSKGKVECIPIRKYVPFGYVFHCNKA